MREVVGMYTNLNDSNGSDPQATAQMPDYGITHYLGPLTKRQSIANTEISTKCEILLSLFLFTHTENEPSIVAAITFLRSHKVLQGDQELSGDYENQADAAHLQTQLLMLSRKHRTCVLLHYPEDGSTQLPFVHGLHIIMHTPNAIVSSTNTTDWLSHHTLLG